MGDAKLLQHPLEGTNRRPDLSSPSHITRADVAPGGSRHLPAVWRKKLDPNEPPATVANGPSGRLESGLLPIRGRFQELFGRVSRWGPREAWPYGRMLRISGRCDRYRPFPRGHGVKPDSIKTLVDS